MNVSFSSTWSDDTNDARRQRTGGISALAAAVAIHALVVVAVLFIHATPNNLQYASANRGLRVTLTTAMRPMPVAPVTAAPPPQRSQKAPKTVAALTSRHLGRRTVVVAPTPSFKTLDVAPPQHPSTEPVMPPATVAEKSSTPPAEPNSATPSLKLPDSQAVMDVAHVECNIPQPEYPSRARRLRHAGSVTIGVTIGTTGQVTQAAIVQTSGFDELDTAAREAMQVARCKPYLDHGVAMAVHALQSIDFNLKKRIHSPY